jgi:hypothetical protein
MRRTVVLSAVLFALPALANQPPVGEVSMGGVTAAFHERYVFGPNISLSRREDGTWAGWVHRVPVELSHVGPDRLVGANVHLWFTRTGGLNEVRGLWWGRPIRFTFKADEVNIRFGNRSQDYLPSGPGLWVPESISEPFPLRLKGAASAPKDWLEHIAFALIASA